jgi:PIN domain nuclease of toxin-antitoxin system
VRLLLDAHALLWWLGDDPTLSAGARASIAEPSNEIFVSAATVWEIAIKTALGKLEAPGSVAAALDAAGFDELPVTAADAEAAGALPPHHRDPFDRMLVAQATRLDAVIVTRDGVFTAYGVRVLSA